MKKSISLFITALLTVVSLSAKIIEAPDLECFESALEKADDKTLVLFDVDDTLLIAKDAVLDPRALKKYQFKILELMLSSEIVPEDVNPKDYFFGQVYSKMEFRLVDPKIVTLIHSLQKREIKALALTLMTTGSCGAIPFLEEWRVEHLKRHNIDFSQAFPHLSELQIQPECHPGRAALYKDGVICTDLLPKGPVLKTFLEKISHSFDKIIFIDNDKNFLLSVENALVDSGIEFLGFHYTFIANQPLIIDEKIAEFQLTHLAKTGIWLTDAEAALIMSK